MKYSIISVDYQNDFCSPSGRYFKDRPCHAFIEKTLVPFLAENGIKLFEMVCDYRLPRPNETEQWCVPGEWGYLSVIDAAVKHSNVWVKGMHSPEWVRDGGGDATATPGYPYQNPAAFDQWLHDTIGSPDQTGMVVLIGLTLEVCVLSTAQQLSFRGYDVHILKEASDIYDLADVEALTKNHIDYKEILFKTSHREFAKLIAWNTLKLEFENNLPHKRAI